MSDPINRLKGHEAPLVGVECSTITPTVVTGDSKGFIKLWSIKDFRLLQTFFVSNVLRLKALILIPKHRKLIAACKF